VEAGRSVSHDLTAAPESDDLELLYGNGGFNPLKGVSLDPVKKGNYDGVVEKTFGVWRTGSLLADADQP